MADQRDDIRNQGQMQQPSQQQRQGQEFKSETPDTHREKDVEFVADEELKQELDES